MPTFQVEVKSKLLKEGPRSLRVPAPDANLARRRGARRALALAEPDLALTIGAEEFHRVAGHVAMGTKVRQVAA